MKRTIALFLAVLLAPMLHAQKDPTSRAWNAPVPPFRIAGNLYYVGAADIASYLITTPKGHILLDGGFEETAPIVLANLKTLGFRIADVRLLIGSHPHLDHAGGLAALKKASGAKFLASAADAPYYASGGRNDPQFGDRLLFPPVAVDRIIADGERVTLGGVSLIARITPGHTPGCTTWTLTVSDGAKKRNVVILGSPTAPEGYTLVGNARYPNIVADYRRQFALLRSLHPDIFLGSHGQFFDLQAKRTSGKANAFVDPEGYRTFIAAKEREFEEKVAAQSIAAQGLVLRQVRDARSRRYARASAIASVERAGRDRASRTASAIRSSRCAMKTQCARSAGRRAQASIANTRAIDLVLQRGRIVSPD